MGVAVKRIRPMTHDDLDEVVSLEQGHQPRPWSEKVFADELGQENRVYLVAGSPIEGFGGVMIMGEEAHVTNLFVAPRQRRRGLGRKLMLALIESAVAAGARHLTLEVRASNVAARALYNSIGLAPVGVRPRYYGDDNALIMWVHDIDEPEFMESLR